MPDTAPAQQHASQLLGSDCDCVGTDVLQLENERDARMGLEQRLSQTLEIVAASRPQQVVLL